jgi:hypothetical protein
MIVTIPQDPEREIWFANRLLVVLRPRQPFIDWANSFVELDEPRHEVEEERSRPSAFLIPIFDYYEDAEEWLEQNFGLLFETQLWQWIGESGDWPQDRSWKAFTDWFDVELLPAPWDVVAEPLHSNPPLPEEDWD